MKPFEKVALRTSTPSKKSTFELNCDHITSQKFMQASPVYYRNLVPKESINISVETLCRLEPMPIPTFGRMKIINRAFFVPFRTIYRAWNDFYTQSLHVYPDGNSGFETKTPFFTTMNLYKFFGLHSTVVASTDPFDWYDGTDYRLFDAQARWFWKVMCSLGYKTAFVDSFDPLLSVSFSALNFLAYVKVLCDWYYPSQYATDQDCSSLIALTKYERYGQVLQVTEQDFEQFVKTFYRVSYDNDYFTSGWDNPIAPDNSGIVIPQSLPDFTNLGGSGQTIVDGFSNGTPHIDVADARFELTDQLITSLRRMTAYFRKSRTAGSRAADRMFAHFGINLQPEKMERSVYINSFAQDVQISDVMANASTGGAQLGDYAGKGISYANGLKFNYNTDEFGVVIVVNTIQPVVSYVSGYDRHNRHLHPLDFYQPSYDSMGVQVIEKGELSTNMQNSGGVNDVDMTLFDATFGFTPRYSEYKFAQDWLTGNFACKSLENGLGLQKWNLARMIPEDNMANFVHSVGFVKGDDAEQYNRIFYTNDDVDNFTMIHHFEVSSHSPLVSLYDTLDFEHEDGNSEITMDNSGPKMN